MNSLFTKYLRITTILYRITFYKQVHHYKDGFVYVSYYSSHTDHTKFWQDSLSLIFAIMASTLTFMLLFWMFSSYDIIQIKIEIDLNITISISLAFKLIFSCMFCFSRQEALRAIWFSFSRLASRDLLAAKLFLVLFAQQWSSFLASGVVIYTQNIHIYPCNPCLINVKSIFSVNI